MPGAQTTDRGFRTAATTLGRKPSAAVTPSDDGRVSARNIGSATPTASSHSDDGRAVSGPLPVSTSATAVAASTVYRDTQPPPE